MTVPKHIGIILDGNRRFAKRLMLKPWKGHEWGAKKFREFTEWSYELGVEEITAYVFSIQNFNRPKDEFSYIMDLFKKELEDILENRLEELKENGTQINFIGRSWLLPEDVQEIMRKVKEATSENSKRRLNFAIAYGGREEILEAVKKIAEQVKSGKLDVEKINEEVFEKELWLNSDPDLIIRTGGEKRTSNFLPWQSTYSEFIFIDKYWPELEKEDLLACVNDFEARERRFGK
jgi:tritrans,polycis-undecaprenyl-diphosphate synthase [geranylgeranyl-diphosphate specific]